MSGAHNVAGQSVGVTSIVAADVLGRSGSSVSVTINSVGGKLAADGVMQASTSKINAIQTHILFQFCERFTNKSYCRANRCNSYSLAIASNGLISSIFRE